MRAIALAANPRPGSLQVVTVILAAANADENSRVQSSS